jgi:hypothetical protein
VKIELHEYDPYVPAILNLDVENGPSWGWGPNGYTYSQVFCIAWKWVDDIDGPLSVPESVILDWRQDDATVRRLLGDVFGCIEVADAFLGHNFSHDTGLLVGTAKDCGAVLPNVDKPVIDTMRSVPKSTGAMRSLEAMCAQFGLGEKPHIDTYTWKKAWVRWDPEALAVVRNRCEMDVILTERLYRKEQEMGWLAS